MFANEAGAPPRRRRFWRDWFPRLVIGLEPIATAAIWLYPSDEIDRGSRVFFTIFSLLVLVVLLAAWVMFFSGWERGTRLAVVSLPLALVVVGGVLTVRRVLFTGDMVPILWFRWGSDHDAELEAHRRSQGQAAAAATLEEKPTDFPGYRGARRDGIVHGPALARDWKAHPPRLLWRQPVGGGYAAFAVAGDSAVTIEQRRDQEAVVCYDTATGKERWVYSYPAFFQESMGGDGPRATPTISGGDVYALGATGMLVCLNGGTGQLRWSHNTLENNSNIPWGMSGSPLVYDQLVVVNPGAQTAAAAGQAVVAFDRASGKKVWSSGNTRAGYASPMLATLAGKRQVLIFGSAELAGYDPADGKKLWRYEWVTNPEVNAAQPLVLDGDRVFISSGYGHGSALVHVEETNGAWKASPVWPRTPNRNMRCKFTSPVAYQGYIYGLDDGVLACLDEKTGDRKWRDGRYGHGQLLLAGDLLMVLTETSGELVVVEATPAGHHELGRIQALSGNKTWNVPALADGKAYVRNNEEMACYDLKP
jgi:outer membrane protein assembly factor BamB